MYIRIIVLIIFLLSFENGSFAAAENSPDIEELFQAIRKNNPQLDSVRKNLDISKSYLLQSKKLPNPQFGIDLENIGTANLQIDTVFSQTYILPQKMEARINIHEIDLELSEAEYLITENQLLNLAFIYFTEALASQEHLKLLNTLVENASNILYIVREKVRAGKVSPLEEHRAGINLENIRIEKDNLEDKLKLLYEKISVISGIPSVTKVQGNIYQQKIHNLTYFMELADNNPGLQLALLNIKKYQLYLINQQKQVLPDISLSSGYRLNLNNQQNILSALAGVSVPIPIFNDNSGNISAASFEIEKTQKDYSAYRNNIKIEIINNYQNYINSARRSLKLEKEIIPPAEKVFNSVLEGYRLGKFSYLDTVDAQKTLYQLRENYINSLKSYHLAAVNLDMLTGISQHSKLIMKGK